mgnify:CR=1 FL=1
MDTIIAISVCVIFAALVLIPIIKNVIRVEKMDDSNWFYSKKLFDRYDKEVNSKKNDEHRI